MKATSSIDTLRELFAELEAADECPGMDLRLDLADFVIRELRDQGLSQRDLARRIGRQPAYISRIVHADANCTFDTAGRILKALGIETRLVDTATGLSAFGVEATIRDAGVSVGFVRFMDITYGTTNDKTQYEEVGNEGWIGDDWTSSARNETAIRSGVVSG